MHWLTSRALILFEVTHSPERAFARDLSGHSYLIPLLILGSLSVLIAIVQAPLQLQWMHYRMESMGAPPDQVSSTLDLVRRMNILGAALLPPFLLLRWALFAFLLWLTAQFFLQTLGFQSTLSIVAYSYVPFLARDASILLVLYLRGREALQHAAGLNVAIGLNLLFPRIPLPWATLAGNINLFEGWFVLLLILGISKVAAVRWQRALAIVLPNWVFTALVQLGLVSLGLSFQKALGQG